MFNFLKQPQFGQVTGPPSALQEPQSRFWHPKRFLKHSSVLALCTALHLSSHGPATAKARLLESIKIIKTFRIAAIYNKKVEVGRCSGRGDEI